MKLTNVLIFLFFAMLLSTPKWSIAIALFLLILALKECRFNQSRLLSWDKLLIGVFIFYFASGLPGFFAEDFRGRVLDAPSRALILIPLFVFLLDGRGKLQSEYVASGVFVGSVLSAIVALYDMFVKHKVEVDGFLFSINFSYIAASLALLSACYLPLRDTVWWRSLAAISVAAALFACFSTSSRGGMLATPLLLLIPFLCGKFNLRRVCAIFLLFVMSTSLLLSFNKHARNNIAMAYEQVLTFEMSDPETHKTSLGKRFNYWTAAYRAMNENPLTGLTYRERVEFYDSMVENEGWPDVRTGDKTNHYAHAHSEYFEAMASKGLLGLCALLLLYLVPLVYFYKSKPQNAADRCNRAAGIIFVLGFCIFGISEAPLLSSLISVYYIVTIIILWALLAPRHSEATDSPKVGAPDSTSDFPASTEKTLA